MADSCQAPGCWGPAAPPHVPATDGDQAQLHHCCRALATRRGDASLDPGRSGSEEVTGMRGQVTRPNALGGLARLPRTAHSSEDR